MGRYQLWTISCSVKMFCKTILGVTILVIFFNESFFCKAVHEDVVNSRIHEDAYEALEDLKILKEDDDIPNHSMKEVKHLIEYLLNLPIDKLMPIYSEAILVLPAVLQGDLSEIPNILKSLKKDAEIRRYIEYLERLPPKDIWKIVSALLAILQEM